MGLKEGNKTMETAGSESLRKPLSESTRLLIEASILNGESGEYLRGTFAPEELEAYFSNPDGVAEVGDAS